MNDRPCIRQLFGPRGRVGFRYRNAKTQHVIHNHVGLATACHRQLSLEFHRERHVIVIPEAHPFTGRPSDAVIARKRDIAFVEGTIHASRWRLTTSQAQVCAFAI